MAAPYVAHDGTVYTDNHILHAKPNRCTHSGAHACATCDHDGYYAAYYPDVCPWSATNKVNR